jgi:cephalosporin hydroxylase
MNLSDKLSLAIKDPRRAARALRARHTQWIVSVHNAVLPRRRPVSLSGVPELDDVKKRSQVRSDISDHLVTLFTESLSATPKLIVELGVRGGESTFVLERVARLCGASLVSVDIEECSYFSSYDKRVFVKSDDIAFARAFPGFCAARGVDPRIDVLFIDTSHLYEHTVQEIDAWFPFLASRAVVFFHDTNLKSIYSRADGSIGAGWDNGRGVIAAIERYFGKSFDENKDFVDAADGWLIRHYAHCAGLTILQKMACLSPVPGADPRLRSDPLRV